MAVPTCPSSSNCIQAHDIYLSPILVFICLFYSKKLFPGKNKRNYLLGGYRDWGQEEKGMAEDEMAGWHHRLDGHEFE